MHVINAAEPLCVEPPIPPSSGHEGCRLSTLSPSLWITRGQSHLTQVIPLPCVEACTEWLVTRDIKTQSSCLDFKTTPKVISVPHLPIGSAGLQLQMHCRPTSYSQLAPLTPSKPPTGKSQSLSSRQRILRHAIVPSHKKSITTFLVHSSFWLKSCCFQLLIDDKIKTRAWFQS